uniref:Wsv427-like protein n=1 Tax=Sicyonia whispovirus TaxID=2984283 RepID=A0A9C7F796_9VIRU|nr:MAG: wsv427-like protein [Sicyonia whispovirus]
MEELLQKINFLHSRVCKEGDTSFMGKGACSREPYVPPKRRRVQLTGPVIEWPCTELMVSNCPAASEAIADSVLGVLAEWEEKILPELRDTKFRVREETCLRAVILSVARCCVAQHLLGLETKLSEPLLKFLFYGCPSRDERVKAILERPSLRPARPTSPPCCRVRDSGEYPPEVGDGAALTPSFSFRALVGEEAIRDMSSCMAAVWKSSCPPVAGGPREPKLQHTLHFTRVWKRLALAFKRYPRHAERDCAVSNLADRQQGCYTAKVGALLYPINTPAGVPAADFFMKAVAELALSPHINIEWKIPLSKFLEKSHAKLTVGLRAGFEEAGSALLGLDSPAPEGDGGDDCEGAEPPHSALAPSPASLREFRNLYGVSLNPSRILPRAANFWDFCRGGSVPSTKRLCIIFDSPSSNPAASSGAGGFAALTDELAADGGALNPTLDAAEQTLRKLVGTFCEADAAVGQDMECRRMSARNWTESDDVLCLNFYPLTLSGAHQDCARSIAGSLPQGTWIKWVQVAMLDSVKRRRNVADKGGRDSDLLSDTSAVNLKTLTIGCEGAIRKTTGLKAFKFEVDFAESMWALGAPAVAQVMSVQNLIKHSFPPLRTNPSRV